MTPTIQELDRLISKTELNPTSKQLLRRVRKAILSGHAENAEVGKYKWTIEISTVDNQPVKMTFSMRRNDRRS